MNKKEKHILEFASFVSDKFASNHEPWRYSRELNGLKHIRYESDYTGYNNWKKRLVRFLDHVTVDYFKHNDFKSSILGKKSIWKLIAEWPMMVGVYWKVYIIKDSNLPDGTVNGNITHWEEDGEYITLFCPMVGREVIKFIQDNPDNEYAKNIMKAMTEVYEHSWGDDVDESA